MLPNDNQDNDLFWAKIQALTTLQEMQAEQNDRLHELTLMQSETARLLNETLKDARADRMADIISARLDAYIEAMKERRAAA